MSIYRYFVLASVSSMLLGGCNSKNSEVEAYLREMQSSPVELALDSMHVIRGEAIHDAKAYKFVAYYDSSECTACQVAHFTEWYSILEQYENDPIEFLYIFETTDTTLLSPLQAIHEEYPSVTVLVDTQKVFRRHNPQIPESSLYHTFLSDSVGRTVLVGNPVRTERIAGLMNSIVRHGSN